MKKEIIIIVIERTKYNFRYVAALKRPRKGSCLGREVSERGEKRGAALTRRTNRNRN